MERITRIQSRYRKFQGTKRIKQILSALHGIKNQSNELHRPNNKPNISRNKKLIPHGSGDFSKDKLLDFLEKWWHKNLVLEKTEEKFIEDFKNWAKEKRYYPNAEKANKICKFAGLNKFLRNYYAKVMASKQENKLLKVA